MAECRGCGKDDDLRFGYCFDCASKGEERAAKRRVYQHLWCGVKKLAKVSRWRSSGHWFEVKCDLTWAWQRLTGTGDYATNGTFDFEGYDWRT